MSRRLIALPFLSSILYILVFPNFNLAWLAWVALVPLTVSLRAVDAPSRRNAFLTGWLAGTIASTGILYWVFVTFRAANLSAALGILCLLLLAGYLGLYWGAWAWFIQRNSNILAGAAGWAALEYLRTHLFSGFPWALLGDSQVRNLPLIQIASVTGVYGVSFLVVLVNLALATLRPRIISVTLAALLVLCGGGFYRLNHPFADPAARPLKVALLQGNVDQYKKWNKAYADEIEHDYEHLVGEAAKSQPDLMIWPETSVPGYLLQDQPLRVWLGNMIRNSHASHLLGVPVLIGISAYNSAFSIDREGRIEGEYDKTHLVPFGEVVPWSKVLGRFVKVLNDLGGFTAGARSPVVSAGGVPVGVNICYEAIFPALVRRSVQAGAKLIVNLTNDGWYMRSNQPYQHWSPNILRAVENGRWVARADNTGISGLIDPYGRVVSASPIFEPAVITGTVMLQSHKTLYTRFGDLFAWACVLFCAFSTLLYILRVL